METSTVEKSELFKSILLFQTKFNESSRVKKLIKRWKRSVMLEAMDTGNKVTFFIDNQELYDVQPGLIEWDPPIHLQADEEILIQIFSGDYNPATALIDGVLAVFSHEGDKIKLEAIAMIIWGLGL